MASYRKVKNENDPGLVAVIADVVKCPITGKNTNLVYQGYPGMHPVVAYDNRAAMRFQESILRRVLPTRTVSAVIRICRGENDDLFAEEREAARADIIAQLLCGNEQAARQKLPSKIRHLSASKIQRLYEAGKLDNLI